MPHRRIIDAHHHLWDLEACEYPWLNERGVTRFFGDPAPIQRNYLVDDLRADAGPYELEGSVHVQVGVAPGVEVAETEWLQRQGDEHGLPSAIVAYCDLAHDEAPDIIAQHMKHDRVRGIRQIIGRSEAEDARTGSGSLPDRRIWRENLALIGELGLSFDLQLVPGQVHRIADVLADVSDTPIALCHCGSPWDQTPSGLAGWRKGLKLLAALPNVYCKISGLGMFDHQWSVASIRPIVESCIDIFGPKRSMFGSNFPVDKLHATYGKVWGAFETIVGDLGVADQAMLFGGTARAFYGID